MHALVGLWSIDILYAPGAQEDTILVFKEDGTGWLAFVHYAVGEVNTFRWEPLDDGRVRIIGDRYFNEAREAPSRVHFPELAYAIGGETSPDGTTRSVVTFAEPLWVRNTRWGLIHRDVAHCEVPKAEPLE